MPTIDNWRALREAASPNATTEVRIRGLDLDAIRSLLDERDQLARSLALVQQHHATAWNRGHTIGMAAQEETVRKAMEAVKADAWGNAQLTEALLAAEAERDRLAAEVDALRADAGRWRYALTCVRIAQHGDFLVSPDDPTGIEHSIAGASFVREVDAAMKGKP